MTHDWMPIESAPKQEFQVILLGRKGQNQTLPCYWDGKQWKGASIFGQGLTYVDPTHWMPLPHGPAPEKSP